MTRSSFHTAARLPIAFVAFFASLLVTFFFVSPAYADQGAVTRTIGGVNYTLPADWDEVEVPAESIEGAELDGAEVAEVVAFTKYDACFVAAHMPTSAGDYVSIDEFKEVAHLANAMLADTPLESVVISAQVEQGCPTLTLYTDAIVFNGVTYALTVKVFAVDTGSTSDAVFMLSFLPADGVLHEDLLELFSYSDDVQSVELASVTYELPGEVALGEGSVFDFEFVVAFGEEGGMLGFEVPDLADNGYLTLSELEVAVADMLPELEYQFAEQGLTDVVTNLWMGAYSFVGFPTVGLEFLVDVGDGSQAYVCCTANITPAGTAFLMIGQPAESDFASFILGSAQALLSQDDGSVPGLDLDTEAKAQEGDLGFVISVQ